MPIFLCFLLDIVYYSSDPEKILLKSKLDYFCIFQPYESKNNVLRYISSIGASNIYFNIFYSESDDDAIGTYAAIRDKNIIYFGKFKIRDFELLVDSSGCQPVTNDLSLLQRRVPENQEMKGK
jgi:hypothetical protein